MWLTNGKSSPLEAKSVATRIDGGALIPCFPLISNYYWVASCLAKPLNLSKALSLILGGISPCMLAVYNPSSAKACSIALALLTELQNTIAAVLCFFWYF